MAREERTISDRVISINNDINISNTKPTAQSSHQDQMSFSPEFTESLAKEITRFSLEVENRYKELAKNADEHKNIALKNLERAEAMISYQAETIVQMENELNSIKLKMIESEKAYETTLIVNEQIKALLTSKNEELKIEAAKTELTAAFDADQDQKLAEQQARIEEQKMLEERAQIEHQRLIEEQKLVEQQTLAAQNKLLEEQKKLIEVQKQAEDQKRLIAAQKLAEEQLLAEQEAAKFAMSELNQKLKENNAELKKTASEKSEVKFTSSPSDARFTLVESEAKVTESNIEPAKADKSSKNVDESERTAMEKISVIKRRRRVHGFH